MVSGVVARRIRCRVLWSDLVASVEWTTLQICVKCWLNRNKSTRLRLVQASSIGKSSKSEHPPVSSWLNRHKAPRESENSPHLRPLIGVVNAYRSCLSIRVLGNIFVMQNRAKYKCWNYVNASASVLPARSISVSIIGWEVSPPPSIETLPFYLTWRTIKPV